MQDIRLCCYASHFSGCLGMNNVILAENHLRDSFLGAIKYSWFDGKVSSRLVGGHRWHYRQQDKVIKNNYSKHHQAAS